MSKEWWLCGCKRAKRSYSMVKVRRGGHAELPLVQGKEQWLHFVGAAVKRYPTSKKWWLSRCSRAEKSYSTFKVRRDGCEEIPLVQGKGQRLCFAGAAVRRYPTPR